MKLPSSICNEVKLLLCLCFNRMNYLGAKAQGFCKLLKAIAPPLRQQKPAPFRVAIHPWL